MSRSTKALLGIGIAAGLVASCVWAFLAARGDLANEQAMDQPLKTPPRVSVDAEGQPIITLDVESQQRIGLKTESPPQTSLQPTVVAYGVLQEDPSQGFTLAPIAGTLQGDSSGRWPALGEMVADGAAVGMIAPWLSPTDQVDLVSKLVAAKADLETTDAALVAANAEYDRLKALNAEGKGVSDRALQEGEANLKGNQARFNAARQTVKTIEGALSNRPGPGGPAVLSASQGGQVVEVLAHPGESVDSGQPIVRLQRFDKLLATVTVPLGQLGDLSAGSARIVVAGWEDRPQQAERVMLSAVVDSKVLGQTLVFRLGDGTLPLRPGMPATAYLSASGEPRRGIVVPRAAVLRYTGRAWAYLQTGPTQFLRREIPVVEPTEQGWFVSGDWDSSHPVVVVGAQVLLSEELKSQIQISD